MSARAIWKGMLSVVGVVNIPVKLYKATEDYESGLKEVHKTCSHPMSRQHFCPHCNTSVQYADVAKGAPQEDGTFVVLSAEDVKSVKAETNDNIMVSSFVPLTSIDGLYVDETYYVTPDGKSGIEGFMLLLAAMAKKKTAMQARFAIHGRERTVTMRACGDGMVLQSMRDINHVRVQSDLPGFVAKNAVVLNPALVKVAEQVIDAYLGEAFDPAEYEDEQKKALDTLIRARKNGTAVPTAAVAAKASTGDLMAALRASLDTKPAKKALGVKVESKGTAKRKKAS